MAAATLVGGKFVLSAIPNVEIVTLLCAVYGYVLGVTGLIAVYVFVVTETLIYGFGTWVISYKPNRILYTAVAVVLTVAFGVFSSLVDVGLASGYFENFGERFAVYYVRGIYFYIAQTVTNLVVFPTLFVPISKAVARVTRRPYVGYVNDRTEEVESTGASRDR